MESLTLKQLQEKCASLNLKQYGTKATMIKRINEHEAKLREKEIDLASQLETALTNNDESNLDLQLEKEESEDEGELIDILKSNPESPDKLSTSCETTFEKEENSNKRRVVKTFYHLFIRLIAKL